MPTIKLRSVKGSPLTNDEVDSSFNTLNVYKVEQTDSTGSALIPKGTVAQRDTSPTTGALRFNTDSAAFEGYTGSAWAPLGRSLSVTDAGGDGSLAYNSGTGVLTYTGPSASEVRAHLSATDAGGDGSFSYNSSTGAFTYTGPSASEVRAHLSATDTGGDGSLAYNSSTGVITYTGPSASEVRAHFSGGTGVTITDGSIAIGQAVATTSDVTFQTLAVDSSMSMTPIDYRKRPAHVTGTMWFDEDEHSFANHGPDSDYIHYNGQRDILRGRNSTGSTITKGTPVYSSGVHISGNAIHGHHPLLVPADASNAAKTEVIGVAAHDIANGAHGWIISRGWLDGLNTASLTTGNVFHLAPGGGFVQAAPSYPNYPVQLGTVLTQDSAGGNGSIYIDIVSHTFDTLRLSNDARVDGDVTIGGNLTVIGSQTIASSENISIGGAFTYFNAGDTIGEANTAFQGTGLDDATLTGHYTHTASNQTFYVKIDATGTPDTYEWGYDSATPQATGVSITGSDQTLNYGISVNFVATTGHTVGDKWTGSASPVNTDTGWFSNRNTGTSGVGYTHVGMFFDVSDEKFKVLSGYDPDPTGAINLADGSVIYGTIKAGTIEANLTGNVTGTVSGNAGSATTLQSARDFSISGDVTASAVSFDGSGNVTLSAAITGGSIVNADINASAAIADTKLATISTGGKVSNSATTATSSNTNSAIVARDGSGNFSAGVITADFNRSANTTVTAGTYGSGSLVPVLTVDSSGFIDSIGSVSVAGVSGVAWDSSTAIYTISTADGNSYPKKIVPNSSFISHDNTTGFVADEHIAHSGVTITAGSGLTGGGTIAASRTINVGAGTGITVAADTVSTNDAQIVHDNLSGFVANEHINHTSVTLTAGNGLTGGGDISASRSFAVGPGVGIKVAADTVSIDSSEVVNYALPIRALFSGSAGVNYNSTTGAFDVNEAAVNHDTLSNFVANEHINHTSVTLTAGNGLTGGGTIAASRSFAVGPGVGIKVGADDVSIDSSEIVNYKLPIVALFSGGTGITLNSTTGAITTTDGDIVHDNLSGFVANEHINHTSVTLTAGNGLTGGGNIAASRSFAVGAGNGITVNANDVAIDSSELTSLYGSTIFTDIKARDGAASGLDADLLDGQHGSYYRINVYNSSGTLLN